MRGEYGRAVTEGLGAFGAEGLLVKAWDEGGVWRFEGVCATGALDRQGERLTAAALGRIAQSQGVELRSAHRAGPIGSVDECWVSGDEVWVRGRLEGQSAEAAAIYTRLRRGGRLGLSVGGKVTGARWAWDAEVERPVRLIEDVELSHVAVCKAEEAVNPGTWVRAAGTAGASPLRLRDAAASADRPAPLRETADGLGGEKAGASPPAPLRNGEGSRGGGETWEGLSPGGLTEAGEAKGEEAQPEPGVETPVLRGASLRDAETAIVSHGASGNMETADGEGRWGGEIREGHFGVDASTNEEQEAENDEKRRPTPNPSLKGGEWETAGAGDGEETARVREAVRRGEPQGLSGHQARPVRAARIWEGVL